MTAFQRAVLIFSQRLSQKNLQISCLVVFSLAFLWSRISVIEGDLAPFEITAYQKIEAFYYAGLAFEWLEGAFEPPALRDGLTSLPGGILYNIIVYLNLLVLGDNYYGFRLNVVLVALATSIIFSYITSIRYGWSGIIASLPIYLCILPWFMASLEVEPTVYRLFHAAVLCAVIIYIDNNNHTRWPGRAMFGVSLLAYSGVLFVYITNFFVIPALFAYQLLRSLRVGRLQEFGRFVLWNAAAAGVACAAWIALTHWIFGSIPLVLNMLGSAGPRVAGAGSLGFWQHIWRNFDGMREFMLFTQFPALFYAYIASICAMACIVCGRTIYWLVKWRRNEDKNSDDIIVNVFSLFSLGFLFQTLFVNDYPVRKMVFVTPFLIFGILLLIFDVAKLSRRIGVFVVACIVGIIVTVNLPVVHRELFVNYSEKMKEAMVSLQPLGSTEVIGGFGHAFRLYNDVRPYLNTYAYVYGHRDLERYEAAMSGRIEGVEPRYSVQILVTHEIVERMAERGFVLERTLLSGKERGVGNVALFKWKDQ